MKISTADHQHEKGNKTTDTRTLEMRPYETCVQEWLRKQIKCAGISTTENNHAIGPRKGGGMQVSQVNQEKEREQRTGERNKRDG